MIDTYNIIFMQAMVFCTVSANQLGLLYARANPIPAFPASARDAAVKTLGTEDQALLVSLFNKSFLLNTEA